ncbi:Transducin-like enhancer protein 4, partial [Dissostichus eleginoides]
MCPCWSQSKITAYFLSEIDGQSCLHVPLEMMRKVSQGGSGCDILSEKKSDFVLLALWQEKVPLQPGQSFKFTVLETLDRIKEEFQFLQAQYHSLKLECEKLASEKTEMQRHYIM